ncbi:MAG: hypothetical protein WBO39_02645 [Ferruginibacter sp.]
MHQFDVLSLYPTITMNPATTSLQALFNRIPRRHSLENVQEINAILGEYEVLLLAIESINPFYEKNIAAFFDDKESALSVIKKSTDPKASKKNKDNLFDEGSGILKESIQALLVLFADGTRIT